MRLLFLRLCSESPPFPLATRCAGLARGPHLVDTVTILVPTKKPLLRMLKDILPESMARSLIGNVCPQVTRRLSRTSLTFCTNGNKPYQTIFLFIKASGVYHFGSFSMGYVSFWLFYKEKKRLLSTDKRRFFNDASRRRGSCCAYRRGPASRGPALPSRLPCPKAVTEIALPGSPHLTRFATRAKRPSSV